MSAEEKIKDIMQRLSLSRIEAIAHAGLGERSEAALRVIKKREIRRVLNN